MGATIYLRTSKGSALTTSELDGNFSNLNSFTTTVNGNVGLLNQLTTTGNTSNLVGAVNHVNADTGVTASTYGNLINIPSFVVNSKGRITSASNVEITAYVGFTSQLTTTGNTSNLVGAVNHVNADTGVTASTYGNLINIPSFVVNSKGRITSASNVEIGTLALTNPFHPNVKFTGNITETSTFITTSRLTATNGTILTRHLSGTTAFTDNLTDGQSVTLLLHGASTYAVTWPGMTWISSSGNTAPTLTNRAGFTFFKQGSNLFGIYLGSYL